MYMDKKEKLIKELGMFGHENNSRQDDSLESVAASLYVIAKVLVDIRGILHEANKVEISGSPTKID